MTDSTNQLLYDQVIKVTHVYLGPAASRFIDRQVDLQLNKEPKDISKDDLFQLIDWIRLAVSLLTDDSEIVEEYTAQLLRLARPASTKE